MDAAGARLPGRGCASPPPAYRQQILQRVLVVGVVTGQQHAVARARLEVDEIAHGRKAKLLLDDDTLGKGDAVLRRVLLGGRGGGVGKRGGGKRGGWQCTGSCGKREAMIINPIQFPRAPSSRRLFPCHCCPRRRGTMRERKSVRGENISGAMGGTRSGASVPKSQGVAAKVE